MVGGLFDLLEGPVADLELFFLPLLGGKGLDDPLAQQTVLDGGVQLADLVALAAESLPQAVVEPDGNDRHQRTQANTISVSGTLAVHKITKEAAILMAR